MNNELQELIIRIIKAAMIAIPIWGLIIMVFIIFVFKNDIKDKKLYKHPTIKPMNIISNLILNSSKPKDVVLDAFIGSGTTAIAAINTKRNFIGFELNKE